MVACVEFLTWAFFRFPWTTHGVGINNRFRGATFAKQFCTSYSNDAKPITILDDFAVGNCGGNITEWSLAGKQNLLRVYMDEHGGCVAATLHALQECVAIWDAAPANVGVDQTAGEVGADAAPAGRRRERSRSQQRAGAARLDFSAYPRESDPSDPKTLTRMLSALDFKPAVPKVEVFGGAKAPPMSLQTQGPKRWGWLPPTESVLRREEAARAKAKATAIPEPAIPPVRARAAAAPAAPKARAAPPATRALVASKSGGGGVAALSAPPKPMVAAKAALSGDGAC